MVTVTAVIRYTRQQASSISEVETKGSAPTREINEVPLGELPWKYDCDKDRTRTRGYKTLRTQNIKDKRYWLYAT